MRTLLFQFTYKIDKIQLNFLQLMSDEATQRISYNCQNSVAFYNPRNSTFDHAVKMLTSDDNELTGNMESRLSYTVLSDSCQVINSMAEKKIWKNIFKELVAASEWHLWVDIYVCIAV